MIFNKKINESPTLKFAEAINVRRRRGEKIISLGLGEPDFKPSKLLIEKLKEVSEYEFSNKYSTSSGLLTLREKIAESLKIKNRLNCKAKNILITPGAKQAIFLSLLALLEPEDEVIVVLPGYVSYIPLIYIAEPHAIVKTVSLNKNNYKLDINKVKRCITNKTKAIIINTPHNPTGMMISKENLAHLYNLATDNKFYIISDEIYDKLVYGNISHFSVGSLEQQVNRVFTINGFSKSHAITGWRIGYACIPEEFISKICKLNQHINTNTSTVLQMAIDSAWPIPEDYLVEYNKKLKTRASLYRDFVDSNNLISGSKPMGSFFSFLNISKLGIDSNKFASKLVDKTGIAVSPGISFGEEWDDHIRFSLAVDEKLLSKSLDRIDEFIRKEEWK